MDPVTVKMPVRKGVTPHSAPTTVAHGTTSPLIGGGFTPGGTTTGPDGAGAATGATAGTAVRAGPLSGAPRTRAHNSATAAPQRRPHQGTNPIYSPGSRPRATGTLRTPRIAASL